ncbi:hypothetical protein QL285_062764 [Trifolium repens]|nr:hypothetical protein QL285_062764 [Trifolium repens]
MINYMEKMGKKSPFLTGIYKRPSLRDWDVKMANQDLQKVHELMGLDNGLTYGVKRLHSTEDGPLVMCFDADTCPLSKAEEHLNYCRGAIRRSNNEKEKAEKDSSIPQTSTQEEESEGANLDNDNVAEDDINAKSVDKDDDDNKDDEADKTNAKGIDEDDKDDKANEINAKGIDEDDNAEWIDKDDDEGEIIAKIIDDSVKEESKIIDDSVKTSSNVQDEVNAKVVDDSMKQPSNANEEMFNAEDDNAERIDEDDDEEEIIAKMIDDSVKAACKVIDDSVKTSNNVQDEMNAKVVDDSMKQPSNAGLTLTQETILKFPEYLGDVNEEINTNDSETAGPATQEAMLKFPEYFDNDSTKEKCSQSLALVFVPEAKGGEKPTECNEEIVLDATPLRTALPDEIIDLDNVTTKKRKKHNMLYSDSTYPERRRAVKKSKYLESPYDDAVHESTSSELEKQLSTYAWSPELDPHDLLYCSNNKAHQYALERQALWSLQQDEWVSCLVINAWVNCLNWNQPRDKMKRLVTPMINYVDLERPGAFDKNNPAAFARFIDRLSKFKYINWKDMDPNSLELDRCLKPFYPRNGF